MLHIGTVIRELTERVPDASLARWGVDTAGSIRKARFAVMLDESENSRDEGKWFQIVRSARSAIVRTTGFCQFPPVPSGPQFLVPVPRKQQFRRARPEWVPRIKSKWHQELHQMGDVLIQSKLRTLATSVFRRQSTGSREFKIPTTNEILLSLIERFACQS